MELDAPTWLLLVARLRRTNTVRRVTVTEGVQRDQ